MRFNRIFLLNHISTNESYLRMRVQWKGNTVVLNLGYRVERAKWNSDTQRVKNGTTHGKKKVPASNINREISRYEMATDKLFARYEMEGVLPSEKDFRDALIREIRGEYKHEEKDNPHIIFVQAFNKYLSDNRNNWALSTSDKRKALLKHLLDFKSDIQFSDLSENGISDYLQFLLSNGMRNTTVKRQNGFVKSFLRWAKANGYNIGEASLTHSIKLRDTQKKVIYLEWDELMKLFSFEFPESMKRLEVSRDVLCLCCFTSLRFSDAKNLKKSDVYDNYISVTTIKTSDTVKIELNKYSRSILDKYKNSQGVYAIPTNSNQITNKDIKQIGELCGLDTPIGLTYYIGNRRCDEVKPKYELLTTHCGRRTFICNALMLGIPPQIVMKWTGHSDYKAMKPYIEISDSAKKNAMKLFNR